MTKKSGLSYKEAGVDIDAGNLLVNNIKPIAKSTQRPEVLTGLGGFGGLFALGHYQQPVLVSGTDGVGTKLKLAEKLAKHDTIGIDLVAMCVNDIIVTGAEPLFFLDYFATSKLNPELATDVIYGIGKGCQQAGCALIGGETAEMPGMYQGEDYDLAGFCVGVVEKANIIDGSTICPGDTLIAIASSGAHSNGYSLIRKILETTQADLTQQFGLSTLGETLLVPTKIYVKPLLALMKQFSIKGLAHITGGGITENLPRILPENVMAKVNSLSWHWPPIFEWLQRQGNIATDEMYRTFNCGVGMILVANENDTDNIIQFLREAGEISWRLGTIAAKEKSDLAVKIDV